MFKFNNKTLLYKITENVYNIIADFKFNTFSF